MHNNLQGDVICDKALQQFRDNLLRSSVLFLALGHLQKWGIDLIGPLPKGRESAFVIVAIDYFTKRVEDEPLAKITEANTSKFLWKNPYASLKFSIQLSRIMGDNSTVRMSEIYVS